MRTTRCHSRPNWQRIRRSSSCSGRSRSESACCQQARASPGSGAKCFRTTSHDIVRRWFGDRTSFPSLDVVIRAESEAARLGLYRNVTGSNVASRATKRVAQAIAGGSFVYEPVAELVASTEEIASRTANRWRQFESDDPQLKEQLLKDVEGAIESMELPEPPDNSDWARPGAVCRVLCRAFTRQRG